MCDIAEADSMFIQLQHQLDQDQELRASILYICKEAGYISRQVTTLLQGIHGNAEAVEQSCRKARGLFFSAQDLFESLSEVLLNSNYFKYQEHWRSIVQKFCFLIALTLWLETGKLATHSYCAEILGASTKEGESAFHLSIEEYFHGLLTLCSEMSSLAVNATSRCDYAETVQISKFVLGLNAGFRLLNLQSEHLRKRVDSLKFDVKKIEEVVYEISIRGLLPNLEAGQNLCPMILN